MSRRWTQRVGGSDTDRLFAQRMGATTIEVASSHVAMVSHPDDTARLIQAAAETVG